MVSSFSRIAVRVGFAITLSIGARPAYAAAPELAAAQGTITISEPRPGLLAPSCLELTVEARDALDGHLIAETKPTTDNVNACRYALTVPAQTPVWLRVRPVLVAGARIINGAPVNSGPSGRVRAQGGSVALRFTIIASATYFFAPNEQKTLPLSY
jgi:hypothetical protein